ncbi:restriction endonuclease [Rufibacter immobilis]|uniref:restriction endonuclease n=1 Tax=Rufibacter immobilis TaxID=1348778 RepID=UPI0035EA45E8
MELAKTLKSGRITLNNTANQIELDNSHITIPYNGISPSDWGQVYEKYVGQILEDEGFNVRYNGLELGFFDKGIDLIAKNEEYINFIQCKFTKKRITKSMIDWILFKSSGKLYQYYKSSGKRLKFTLIVNDIEANFSKKIPN